MSANSSSELTQHCRLLAREHDYSRYCLGLLLPAEMQPPYWAITAFNVEISRAAEMTEAATAAIRLKWWEEALTNSHTHPVADALRLHELNISPLKQAIHAREVDADTGYLFADIAALDHYAQQTGGLWAALGKHKEEQHWLTQLGQYYALQGLLWSTGYHLQQERCMIPEALFSAHDHNVFSLPTDEAAREHHYQAMCHLIKTLAKRIETSMKVGESSIIPHPLNTVLSLIAWRCKLLQNKPELALQSPPPDYRLRQWWHLLTGKQHG